MTNHDICYTIALLAVDGVGPTRCRRLMAAFGNAEAVLKASYNDLIHIEDIGEQTANSIVSAKAQLSDAEKVCEQVEKLGLTLLSDSNPDYPEPLKQISDPPILLYAKGKLKPQWDRAIAIVGSRLATEYGKKIAYQLGDEFSSNGWTVVSGMAIGIDGAAHKGAIAGLIGSTVAVLGCGLDIVYPPQHKELMQHIEEHGLLLSEYPPGLQPDARFFPQRNRIISGLTVGTIVVEARERSGALLTADSALEQNRDLFAVPGLVSSHLSRGPHRLIQKGAKLITCAEDVIGEYQSREALRPKPKVKVAELSAEARKMAEILQSEAMTADKLSEKTGMGIGQLLAHLTDMQLKNLVVTVGSEFHWNGGKV